MLNDTIKNGKTRLLALMLTSLLVAFYLLNGANSASAQIIICNNIFGDTVNTCDGEEIEFDCNNVTEIPIGECEALVAFYNLPDLNGAWGSPNRAPRSHWLQTNTPCSWIGVTCHNGSIVELDASGESDHYQYDYIPAEIGNLTNLTKLDLSENRVYNLPTEFATLTNLVELNLGQNNVIIVPDELWQLPNLARLNLSENSIVTLPDEIGNITNLSQLFIGGNPLEGDFLAPLTTLSNLQELGLSNMGLTSLPATIGQLSNLIALSLNYNELSPLPAELFTLTQLQMLLLRENQLTELPSEIGNLTNLSRLHLADNSLSDIPAEIANLTNLTELSLHNNELATMPDGLQAIAGRVELSLIDNPLDEDIIREHFTCRYVTNISAEQCEALVALYRSTNGNDWNEDAKHDWLLDFEPCRYRDWHGMECEYIHPRIDDKQMITVINLSNVGMSGEVPAKITDLIYLERLDLSNNNITSISPNIGTFPPTMRSLDLNDNQITEIPPALATQPHLLSLYLRNNLIREIPAEIGQSNITELNLQDNLLTSLPPEIGSMSNLQKLYVQRNQLTAIPTELRNASVRILNLSENQLTTFPIAENDYASLEHLYLDDNQLTEVSPELSRLPNLSLLHLSGNPFTDLPLSVAYTIHTFSDSYYGIYGWVDAEFDINLGDFLTTDLDCETVTEITVEQCRALLPYVRGSVRGELDQAFLENDLTFDTMSGVEVEIVGIIDGEISRTVQTTDVDGRYTFNLLPYGNYTLTVNTSDAGIVIDEPDETLDGSINITLTPENKDVEYAPFVYCTNCETQAQQFDCTRVTEIPTVECEALVDLFVATNGYGWTRPHHYGTRWYRTWLRAVSPCLWEGITCEDGHVTQISVAETEGMKGAVPATIGNLTELTQLTLTGNLTELPPELGTLPNLWMLNLSYNPWTTIPAEVETLPSLTTLHLNNSNLTTLPLNIGNMTNLQQLELRGNQLTTFPLEIITLPNLGMLDLKNNQLTDLPSEIENLTTLRRLRLGSNSFAELPAEIGNLTNLVELDVSSTPLTTLPSEIVGLTSLTTLNLSHSDLIVLPPEIGQLATLTALYVRGLHTLPFEVGYLTNLQTLSVRNYNTDNIVCLPIEVLGLAEANDLFAWYEEYPSCVVDSTARCGNETGNIPLNECEALITLFRSTVPNASQHNANLEQYNHETMEYEPHPLISGNWLNSNAPCEWAGVECEDGHITQVNLHDVGLEGAIPPEIGNLTELTHLGFANNALTELPIEIGDLTNLQYFGVTGNPGVSLPSEIETLPNLVGLYLYENQYTTLPLNVGSMTSLEELHLWGNELATLPPEIGEMTNLRELVVRDNRLTQLPDELTNLTNLTRLDVRYNPALTTLPDNINGMSNLVQIETNGTQIACDAADCPDIPLAVGYHHHRAISQESMILILSAVLTLAFMTLGVKHA